MLDESRGSEPLVLEAEPGNLDIKRWEAGILFITLPFVSPFKMAFTT